MTDRSLLSWLAARDAAVEIAHDFMSAEEAHDNDFEEGQTNAAKLLRDAIRAMPEPDHAAILVSALQLPEIAALVEAAYGTLDAIDKYNRANGTAIIGGPPMRMAKALGKIKALAAIDGVLP